MRLFFIGPRLFGGLIRPGVSFGMPRWRRAQQFGRASANWDSVYVLEGAPGHVKIGESNDPVSRRAALQTGSPFPLRLVFSIPCARAFDVEQEAHAILASHRADGGNDWFLANKETAIGAIFGAASRLGVSLGNDPERASGMPTDEKLALVGILLFYVLMYWTAVHFWG